MYKIRDWLYVASYRETQDQTHLQQHHVGAILHLQQLVEHDGIATLYLPIQEGLPILKSQVTQGLNFIQQQHDQGKVVVIACGAGISRSVIFAVAALKLIEHISLSQAFSDIRKVHERAMPDDVHWESMCQYFDEHIDFWEMWRTIDL